MRRPWLSTLLVLVLATAGCGGKAPRPASTSKAPAATGSDFVGIYSDDVLFGDAAYRRDTLARERAAGVDLIRQPFGWAAFERDPAQFDGFVGAAAQARIRVLPVLVGPDPGSPAGAGGMRPPAQPERFAGWAALMVQRYGPNGSFWQQHPDLPRLPIGAWQIWNEPNIPAWWAPQPDPVAYAHLLEQTSAAIRKVDPHAEIVAAGLPTSHLGAPGPDFLAAVYKAGAKGSFDTAAVHPYAADPAAVVERVKALQRVIIDNSDHAQLWVTEVGWGSAGAPGPLTVTPAQQASYVRATVMQLHALGVRGVVVFQWRDPKPVPGRREIWPYHAGLMNADGTAKPSLAAFTSAARAVTK